MKFAALWAALGAARALPPPAADPIGFVPASFEGVAVIVPLFEELGARDSYRDRAEMVSIGPGVAMYFKRTA